MTTNKQVNSTDPPILSNSSSDNENSHGNSLSLAQSANSLEIAPSVPDLYDIIKDLRRQVSDLHRSLSEQQISQNRLWAQVRLMTNQLDKLTFSPLMLPDEITIRIFSYLTGPELGNISLVCKDWLRISTDPLLWKTLVERTFGPHIRPRTLHLNLQNGDINSGALLYYAQQSQRKRTALPVTIKHTFDISSYKTQRSMELNSQEPTHNETNFALIPREDSRDSSSSSSFSSKNKRRVSSHNDLSNLLLSSTPISHKRANSATNSPSLQSHPMHQDLQFRTRSATTSSPASTSAVSPSRSSNPNNSDYFSPNQNSTHQRRLSALSLKSTGSLSSTGSTTNTKYLQTWKDRYLELYLLEKNWRSMFFRGHTYNFHTETVSVVAAPLGTSSQPTGVVKLSHQFTQNTIVSAGMDGRIVIWDLTRHSPIHVLSRHRGQINCLQVSDSLIASGGGFGDPSVRVWDRFSGNQLFSFEDHTGFIRCLQFDTDILVSGSVDKTVRCYSLNSGQPICTFGGHTKGIFSLSFDDTMIASGSHDKTIRLYPRQIENLYNPSLPIPAQAVLHGHTSTVLDIAMTRSIPDSANLNHLTAKSTRIHSKSVLLESPFNPYLVSASRDCSLRLWDKSVAKSVSVLAGHTAAVHLAKVRGTSIILSASHDGTVRLWDVRAGSCSPNLKAVSVFEGHRGPINCMIASDLKIITGGEDATIRVWEQRMGPSIISSSSSRRSTRLHMASSLVLAYGLESHLPLKEPITEETNKSGSTYTLSSAITTMDLLAARQRLVVGTRSGKISWFDFAFDIPHIQSLDKI